MGRMLVTTIHADRGATLAGAIERAGSPLLGRMRGCSPALRERRHDVTADPLAVFAKADGVLDFTAPAATVAFAELAAQARIVHVIGTTGLADERRRGDRRARAARGRSSSPAT